jgi:mitochondrial fission protein ELM1
LASDQHNRLTAWALTTGEAGMRTQARGLARAVAGDAVEKVSPVRRPWPWRWGWSGRLMRLGLAPGADPLAPPWPDLIVSSGRRSALLAREVKRLAGGGRPTSAPVLVHVQDPRAGTADFDLIVAMEHDRVEGANVIRVATALHDVTPARLAAAGAAWADRLGRLPRPLVGVILGGPAGAASPFGEAEAGRLLAGLRAMRTQTGAGLAIIPSRRTPEKALAVFASAGAADPGLWTWDRAGDNPYLGVLALADRLVVTGDSVSMVSEALATPHPVEVFAGRLRDRHQAFLANLEAKGLVRRFDGRWTEAAPRAPVDATAQAAQAVRDLLARRMAQRGV